MKTILVIEDEETVRESILDLLEAEGFQGLGSENGNQGMQLAREQHPDLILCDVQMPDINGFDLLSQLRSSPDTAAIPFIFLTARTTKTDIRQGMALGADDYLTKPCTATELLGAVSGRLAKYEAMAALYQQKTQSEATSMLVPPKPETVASETSVETTALGSFSTRDGLLNHFYQELRNPLSNINMALHFLRSEGPIDESMRATIQNEYSRELAVLQQVYKLQEHLMPESAALLRQCNLVDL